MARGSRSPPAASTCTDSKLSLLPRPICEKDDNGFGIDPNHNPNFAFGLWRGSHGGWKADWDATWYELAALFCQVFVLILLPLTTTSVGRDINKTLGGGDAKKGREVVANLQQGLERVNGGSDRVGARLPLAAAPAER